MKSYISAALIFAALLVTVPAAPLFASEISSRHRQPDRKAGKRFRRIRKEYGAGKQRKLKKNHQKAIRCLILPQERSRIYPLLIIL